MQLYVRFVVYVHIHIYLCSEYCVQEAGALQRAAEAEEARVAALAEEGRREQDRLRKEKEAAAQEERDLYDRRQQEEINKRITEAAAAMVKVQQEEDHDILKLGRQTEAAARSE